MFALGQSKIDLTLTEYKDSDGNKKACDVIARPNPDGVPELAIVHYLSNIFIQAATPTLTTTSGSYKSELFYMEDESPPFGRKGNGSGGKVMRTKINGVDLDPRLFKDFLKFSHYGARKKRTN